MTEADAKIFTGGNELQQFEFPGNKGRRGFISWNGLGLGRAQSGKSELSCHMVR